MQETTQVSVILLVVGVSREVTGPVETAVVVPDWHYVFRSGDHRFDLVEDLAHQSDKVLGGVAIDSCDSIALFHGELFHHIFHDSIGILVKFLEIMSKVP